MTTKKDGQEVSYTQNREKLQEVFSILCDEYAEDVLAFHELSDGLEEVVQRAEMMWRRIERKGKKLDKKKQVIQSLEVELQESGIDAVGAVDTGEEPEQEEVKAEAKATKRKIKSSSLKWWESLDEEARQAIISAYLSDEVTIADLYSICSELEGNPFPGVRTTFIRFMSDIAK